MISKSDLKTIIELKSPGFFERLPGFLSTTLLRTLERIVHADELLDFFTQHGAKKDWQFINAVFEYLDFSYAATADDQKKIPAEGRLICVANHGNGPLDGLILLNLIGAVRQDVKIIVSDVLAKLENLADLFLLYDQYSSGFQKQNILAIKQAFLAEQTVIFFPAGEVTKLSWRGLREPAWLTGAVSFSRKYDVPILPVYIEAKNSLLYYLATLLHRDASMLLLSHEMFKKRSTTISVKIGDLLSSSLFTSSRRSDIAAQTQILRKHVHSLRSLGNKRLG